MCGFVAAKSFKNFKKNKNGGVTQGCTWGSLIYCVAVLPLLVEALAPPELSEVHALGICDDTTLAGPVDHIITAGIRLQSILEERANLTTKKWELLLGPEAPRPTQRQLDSLGSDVRVFCASAGGGDVGVTDGGDSGCRLLGAPVGSADYARRFVQKVVAAHKHRLDRIASFGEAGYAQEALLLLLQCARPRLVYLLQVVPFGVAPEHYREAHDDLLRAFGRITRISPQSMQLDGGFVKDRAALPLRWGGQGITNPATIANPALIGNWVACAPFLASVSPALKNIACRAPLPRTGPRTRLNLAASRAAAAADPAELPVQGGPAWGHLEPAWEHMRSLGDSEKKLLLCSFSESTQVDRFMFATKGNQRALSALSHQREFWRIHAQALSAGRLDIAAAMLSLRGPGATAWHSVAPSEPDFTLTAPQVHLAVHFELNLPIPAFVEAFSSRQSVHCCPSTHPPLPPQPMLHHLLTLSHGNPGGSRHSLHNDIRDKVCAITTRAGCPTATEVTGLLPARANPDGSLTDPRLDLRIDGLDSGVVATLADTTVRHVMTGTIAHPPRPQHSAHRKAGGAIRVAHREKNATYKEPAEHAGYNFVPLAVETYGRMGKPFVALLKDAAKLEAEHAPTRATVVGRGEQGRPAGLLALRGFILRRNMARISVARINAITRRIIGSTVKNQRAAGAASPVATLAEFALHPDLAPVSD